MSDGDPNIDVWLHPSDDAIEIRIGDETLLDMFAMRIAGCFTAGREEAHRKQIAVDIWDTAEAVMAERKRRYGP